MQSLHSAASTIEADGAGFLFDSPDNSQLENRVVSPCGRFESFDYKGNHFEIDWDEISPPGDTEEEDERDGMPHEQFMEELRLYVDELVARREAGR